MKYVYVDSKGLIVTPTNILDKWKESKMKMYEVGTTFSYPDYKWWWVTQIPEEVALAWIAMKCPDSVIGVSRGENASRVREGRAQWLNKIAIVIENERDLIALYKHDFACWVIRKKEDV